MRRAPVSWLAGAAAAAHRLLLPTAERARVRLLLPAHRAPWPSRPPTFTRHLYYLPSFLRVPRSLCWHPNLARHLSLVLHQRAHSRSLLFRPLRHAPPPHPSPPPCHIGPPPSPVTHRPPPTLTLPVLLARSLFTLAHRDCPHPSPTPSPPPNPHASPFTPLFPPPDHKPDIFHPSCCCALSLPLCPPPPKRRSVTTPTPPHSLARPSPQRAPWNHTCVVHLSPRQAVIDVVWAKLVRRTYVIDPPCARPPPAPLPLPLNPCCCLQASRARAHAVCGAPTSMGATAQARAGGRRRGPSRKCSVSGARANQLRRADARVCDGGGGERPRATCFAPQGKVPPAEGRAPAAAACRAGGPIRL